MKSFLYLLPLGLAALTVSCKSNPKVASTNPYQNNPYYSSSSTTNYSSTPSNAAYPSYTESTYTPPSSVPGPSVPSVPSVPTYTGTATSAPAVSASSGSKSHSVASGETLYGIAKRNGTTVSAIKTANALSGDTIRIGQKLVIP